MEEGARRFTEATVVKGLRTVPTNSKVFFPVYEYAGKEDLKKSY